MVAYGKVMLTVKKRIVKLLSLNEYSDGILMSDFVSNYTRHIGRSLSYHDLGYGTLHEFISAIPDVARIQRSEADPNRMVVAMAPPKTEFPKNVNSTRQHFQKEEHFDSNTHIPLDPEVENLEPDRFGRFSLCMPRDSFPLSVDDDDIKDEFSPSGNVANVHKTEKLIFIRFTSKEELQNCLHMFKSKYDLRLGRQSSKNESSSNENQRQRQNHSEKPPMKSKSHNNNNHSQPQRSHANHSEGPSGDADRRRGGRRFGNQSEMNNSPDSRSHLSEISKGRSGDEEQSTELFISNIESKEDFEEMMQAYSPKKMNVIVQDVRKYAFVSMWSHGEALDVIQDLDSKMQSSRNLSVKFNKEKHRSQSDRSSSISDSCTDVGVEPRRGGGGGYHNGGAKPKTKAPKENGRVDSSMPELESSVDLSRMPPLVPDSQVADPEGLYDLDTSVLVTNFPPRTMESQLRAVFKGYRVLDICVLNNGYPDGCTRALLYMSTIYEAVRAVRDDQGFVMDGYPLKVIPPKDNILLKKIIVRMNTGLRDWN